MKIDVCAYFLTHADISIGTTCQVDLLSKIMHDCLSNFDKLCQIAPAIGVLSHTYTRQYKKSSPDAFFDQCNVKESFS